MTRLDGALRRVDETIDQGLAKLLDLIAIPSVSGDPAGAGAVARAAGWLREELAAIGLDARLVPTAGHPMVLARSGGAATPGPRLLFYGHYDVQPPGDASAWRHPPFAPRVTEEDGLRRLYGRGASDSKSQLWSFVVALKAWRATYGDFPGEVIVLLEGEEEAGSPSLPAFLAQHRGELACDIAFVCDGDMLAREQPTLTTRLKGLIHEKVTIQAPNPDLHSGHWGAVAANPVRILCDILASLYAADGRIAIAGFYDGVEDIPPALRAQWAALSGAASLTEDADLTGGRIETGYTPIEAIWGRPTIDINGIGGGNQGPGERSVLPGSAMARLSFRLVGGQTPDRIRERFRAHVRTRLPPGCNVSFEGAGGIPASVMAEDGPLVQAAARGLAAEWGRPTLFKGSGGAIPLVQALGDSLGVDCIVIGFILGDDAIHAPDERYDVERFHRGTRAWVRILAEIGALQDGGAGAVPPGARA